MHKAGKVVFKITNGSAFFCTRDIHPNMSKKMLLLKKEKPAKVVLGHTHTADPRSD